MKLGIVLPVALATVTAATAADANWFANPALGINRNVGSAPSPTPEQVRANRMPPFVLREQDSSGTTVAQAAAETRQVAANEQPSAQVTQNAAPSR